MLHALNRDTSSWSTVRITDFPVHMHPMSAFSYFDCRKPASIASVLAIDVGINFEGGKEYVNQQVCKHWRVTTSSSPVFWRTRGEPWRRAPWSSLGALCYSILFPAHPIQENVRFPFLIDLLGCPGSRPEKISNDPYSDASTSGISLPCIMIGNNYSSLHLNLRSSLITGKQVIPLASSSWDRIAEMCWPGVLQGRI